MLLRGNFGHFKDNLDKSQMSRSDVNKGGKLQVYSTGSTSRDYRKYPGISWNSNKSPKSLIFSKNKDYFYTENEKRHKSAVFNPAA